MQRIRKAAAALLASLLAAACLLLPLAAEGDTGETEEPLVLEHAAAAYLLNLEHDLVIFESGTQEKVYPTATVKMMVGLLAIEQYSEQLDQPVTLTAAMLAGVSGNNIGLTAGETVTYRDLILATLVGGANDAATALAVSIAGDVSSFVDRMNDRAAALGAVSTNYTNPSGMHDAAMYTTCADTALIAKEAYRSSLYMEFSSLEKYVMPATNRSEERTIHNKNALLSRALETKYYYKYAHGMSSGFTTQGGYSLVTTASLDGATYLCVVMGAESEGGTIYSYTQATKLFRYAFSHYGYRDVLAEGEILAEIPVRLSSSVDYVSCVPESALRCYMPLSENLSYAVTKTIKLHESQLEAPVAKGQTVGMVTVTYEDKIVGNVNLLASSDLSRSEFLYAMERIKAFATSRFFLAAAISAVLLFLIYTFGTAVIRYRRDQKKLRR